jgi:hypothetical protein
MEELNEATWKLLLRRMRDGDCTPFLGAGASSGSIPVASQMAREWAAEQGYPLADCSDLAKVAQYMAVMEDNLAPKELVRNQFESVKPPDFLDPLEPHRVLADLPIPVYITTNYDEFMIDALRASRRDPVQELCRWNGYMRSFHPSAFETRRDYRPSVATPLVFHLHGSFKVPESIVLTEDDYLDFLISIGCAT